MELSVVIPIYDEVDSIVPLCRSVRRVLEAREMDFEIVVVDDGSTDGSAAAVRALIPSDPHLRLVRLRRNFGQTAALNAGFHHARGRLIVTLDGDLQNDPADIPRLLEKIEEGYDLVVGWRRNRQDGWVLRTLPSLIANRLVRATTKAPVRDNGCALKAIRAETLAAIPMYSEMHRLLPAVFSLAGAAVCDVEVSHHPRRHGVSKYGLSRVPRVVSDLIALTAIMTRARRPFFGLGGPAVLVGLLAVAALVAGTLHLGNHPAETVVVYVGTSLLLGSLSAFLLTAGVLAELICRRNPERLESVFARAPGG